MSSRQRQRSKIVKVGTWAAKSGCELREGVSEEQWFFSPVVLWMFGRVDDIRPTIVACSRFFPFSCCLKKRGVKREAAARPSLATSSLRMLILFSIYFPIKSLAKITKCRRSSALDLVTRSFPSFRYGFDSRRPLQILNELRCARVFQ